MYLNRIQQHVMELLRDYGCLKKTQLETMTKQAIKGRYDNIDGYLNQMRIFKQIEMANASVMLPGKIFDDSMIFAFDVMMEFREYIISHRKGTSPVAIRFVTNDAGEFCIIPVKQGYEREMAAFSNVNFSAKSCSVIFALETKQQMDLFRPDCRYSFAVREGDGILFFDGI